MSFDVSISNENIFLAFRQIFFFGLFSFLSVRRLILETFSTSSDNPLTSLQGLLAQHRHRHHQLLPRRDTPAQTSSSDLPLFLSDEIFFSPKNSVWKDSFRKSWKAIPGCFVLFSAFNETYSEWLFSKEVPIWIEKLFGNKIRFKVAQTQLFFSVSFYLLLVGLLTSQIVPV